MRCRSKKCSIRVSVAGQAIPCAYCKKPYCRKHRLPEYHNCPDLEEGLKNKVVREVKPKFVDYPRSGQIGA